MVRALSVGGPCPAFELTDYCLVTMTGCHLFFKTVTRLFMVLFKG